LRRGLEVLGYDKYGGSFHSFRCHQLDQDFAQLGVSFNTCGLIDDETQAFECAELARAKGCCADDWQPWLIVEDAS